MTELLNKVTQGDCLEVLRTQIADNSIDLTVTSPPYDNLRTYKGFSFDFEQIAKELYRVTKPGGVIVWVVADATVNGSETGTSFKQALFFKEIGFNLLDTMIYLKQNPQPLNTKKRYNPSFEFMFVLSKGAPKTVNLLTEECLFAGRRNTATARNSNRDELVKTAGYGKQVKPTKTKGNVWAYTVGGGGTKKWGVHPAVFPEQLAEDHILSWSNPGDIVLDIFGGSGTTAKMSVLNDRNFIHVDISDEYITMANKRIADALSAKGGN